VLISAQLAAFQVAIFECNILFATVLVQSTSGVFICSNALSAAVKKDSRRTEERPVLAVRNGGRFHFSWTWHSVALVMMSRSELSLSLTSMRVGIQQSVSLSLGDFNCSVVFLESLSASAVAADTLGESG
jgi:hypothetical protein